MNQSRKSGVSSSNNKQKVSSSDLFQPVLEKRGNFSFGKSIGSRKSANGPQLKKSQNNEQLQEEAQQITQESQGRFLCQQFTIEGESPSSLQKVSFVSNSYQSLKKLGIDSVGHYVVDKTQFVTPSSQVPTKRKGSAKGNFVSDQKRKSAQNGSILYSNFLVSADVNQSAAAKDIQNIPLSKEPVQELLFQDLNESVNLRESTDSSKLIQLDPSPSNLLIQSSLSQIESLFGKRSSQFSLFQSPDPLKKVKDLPTGLSNRSSLVIVSSKRPSISQISQQKSENQTPYLGNVNDSLNANNFQQKNFQSPISSSKRQSPDKKKTGGQRGMQILDSQKITPSELQTESNLTQNSLIQRESLMKIGGISRLDINRESVSYSVLNQTENKTPFDLSNTLKQQLLSNKKLIRLESSKSKGRNSSFKSNSTLPKQTKDLSALKSYIEQKIKLIQPTPHECINKQVLYIKKAYGNGKLPRSNGKSEDSLKKMKGEKSRNSFEKVGKTENIQQFNKILRQLRSPVKQIIQTPLNQGSNLKLKIKKNPYKTVNQNVRKQVTSQMAKPVAPIQKTNVTNEDIFAQIQFVPSRTQKLVQSVSVDNQLLNDQIDDKNPPIKTQESAIRQMLRDNLQNKFVKKQISMTQKKIEAMELPRHLFKKHTEVQRDREGENSHLGNDDLLQDTPKKTTDDNMDFNTDSKGNMDSRHSRKELYEKPVAVINSISELLSLFGIKSFNGINKTFKFNDKVYKIDIREMVKEAQIFRIKSDPLDIIGRQDSSYNMGIGLTSNQDEEERRQQQVYDSQILSYPISQVDNQSRFQNMTQRSYLIHQGLGVAVENSSTNHLIELCNQSNSGLNQIDHQLTNGMVVRPLHNQSVSPRPQYEQMQYINKLDFLSLRTGPVEMQGSNQKSNRSALSGASANQSNVRKSPIVAEHEQNARRMRSNNERRGSYIHNQSGSGMNGLTVDKHQNTDIQTRQFNPPFNQSSFQNLRHPSFFSSEQFTNFPPPPFNQHLPFDQNPGQSQVLNQPWTSYSQMKPSRHELMFQESQLSQTEGGLHPDDLKFVQKQITYKSQYTNNSDTPIIDPQNLLDSKYIHLAFLFASPLMLKTSDQKYYDVLPPISFAEEFEQIKQYIEEKQISFNYRYSVATAKNLQTALRENPIGLHFSGHGFQNNESLYQGDKKSWLKYKNKGDVLIFENENGASDFFFTTDLQKMVKEVKKQVMKLREQQRLEQQNLHNAQQIPPRIQVLNEEVNISRSETPNKSESSDSKSHNSETKLETEVLPTELQFVYVASCHSEQVGKIFLDAGIPHVICIDQNQTILDKAAIEFSKFFYDEVFDSYNSICDAYAYAKEKVEKNFGKFQADKIMLLTNEKTHGTKCKCDERLKPRRGFMRRIGLDNDVFVLPNRVTPFVSRNQDMFDTLNLLTEKNIVQIFGMPGLGKSSLLKNVTCFLGERDIYRDGVLYIDFYHVRTFKEAIEIINAYLRVNNDEHFFSSFNQDQFLGEVDRLKVKIRLYRKFLFAIDNIDHLEKEDHEQFLKFLSEVGSSQFKILFTSAKYQVDVFNQSYSVKKIQKLRKYDSVDLFMKKVPLGETDKQQLFEYENILDLHQVTIQKYGEGSNIIPELCKMKHAHSLSCVMKYLQNHPIFQFLSGIPLVISMVAPFAVYKSLSEIFLYLADKNSRNFQSDLLNKRMDEESLIHCLEYCFTHLETIPDSPILDQWIMIALTGPGILYEDLKVIYCANKEEQDKEKQQKQLTTEGKPAEDLLTSQQKLDKNLEELINFSLIEREGLDKAGQMLRFRVSPFVEQYIQIKIDLQTKMESLNIVCTHLNNVLIGFKKKYSEAITQCQQPDDFDKIIVQLEDQIKPYENQILYIVHLILKIQAEEPPKSEESSGSDEEEVEAPKPIVRKISRRNSIQNIENLESNFQNQIQNADQQSRRMSRRGSKQCKRDKSKDMPIVFVSDYVKFGRSTFKVNKDGTTNNPRITAMLAEPPVQIGGTMDRQKLKEGLSINRHETVIVERQRRPSMFRNGQTKGDGDLIEQETEQRQILKDKIKSQQLENTLKMGPNIVIKDLKDMSESASIRLGSSLKESIVQVSQLESKQEIQNFNNPSKNNNTFGQGESIASDSEIKSQDEIIQTKRPVPTFKRQKTLRQPNGKKKEIMELDDLEMKSRSDMEQSDLLKTQSIKDYQVEFSRKTSNLEEDSEDIFIRKSSEESQNQQIKLSKQRSQSLDSKLMTRRSRDDAANVFEEAQRNNKPLILDLDKLKLPLHQESQKLDLVSQKSSGYFEKQVNPFEIAKMCNPQFDPTNEYEECDITRFMFDDARISSQHEAPNQEDISTIQRRATLLKQRVNTKRIEKGNSCIQKIRDGILESLNREQANINPQTRPFVQNPDLPHDQDSKWVRNSNDLGTIEESLNSLSLTNQSCSAPSASSLQFRYHSQVQRGYTRIEKGEDGVQGGFEKVKEKKVLKLEAYEEMFFHFLSMLALIPNKRERLIQILDTYNQRDKNNQSQTDKEGFDLIGQAEKRMKNFETIIEIPDEAKLLRANTMLLELFVTIMDQNLSLQSINKSNRINNFDLVYETANQMRLLFEDIQFERGLGILDYIQARRLYRMNRKVQDFKILIKQAVARFKTTYEVEGISQCISEARRILKVTNEDLNKPISKSNEEKILSMQGVAAQVHQENIDFVRELEESFKELLTSEDEQVRKFIKFREESKIPNLVARVVCQFNDAQSCASGNYITKTETPSNEAITNMCTPDVLSLSPHMQTKQTKIYVDQIYNMLLNPQQHLTIFVDRLQKLA